VLPIFSLLFKGYVIGTPTRYLRIPTELRYSEGDDAFLLPHFISNEEEKGLGREIGLLGIELARAIWDRPPERGF
jgi:hypothetical protein